MAATDPQNRVQLFQRAAEVLEAYINEFPNHPNAEMAWYYLGNSYFMGGQPDNGKRCFHTLLNRYGKGKWAAAAAYTLANDHYSKGEYAFAAPLFERFADNAGVVEERPRGNFYAGESYRMLGRDSDALSAYKKVLDDPAGRAFAAGAKLHTAQIQLKAGKNQEALTLFEDVIANNGNPPLLRGEAAFGASAAAEKLDQHEVADKYLKYLLTSPSMEAFRPNAQTALMANAFERKDFKEVIAIYRRITVPAPAEGEKIKEASRLMLAARSYMELKQPIDAQQLFRQVEELVPPENELAFQAAYYRLHCFFQIEGHHVPEQVDGFLEIYRKTRPPNDPRIHTALFIKAETLFANKDNAAAAKVFSEIDASALSEENRPGLLYKRGWCLAETGDPQGAIRSLTDFITKYPKDERYPSALAKRAKAYAEIGESAKAIVDFDQLTADGVPSELQSFAWLESARMRRTESNVPDMILRYKGLLGKVGNLSDKLQGEANYWIGWGLVKQNTAPEAVPYLEKARSLDAATYKKHAGLLLALGYHAAQDPQKLAAEINLAIDGKYVADIPDQTLQWAGMQAYGGNDYKSAARFLNLIANPAEPRETAKEIWRYLAKARLESGDNAGALVAADNVLAVEDNPGWKADGLVDKGRALLALNRPAEARNAANDADALRPQGRTSALLRILSGDLFVKEGNLDQAASQYVIVVKLHDDADLKPLAISKTIRIFDQKGDKAEADKYRDQLAREFPNWKAP
jgi:TolA-binding protein